MASDKQNHYCIHIKNKSNTLFSVLQHYELPQSPGGLETRLKTQHSNNKAKGRK